MKIKELPESVLADLIRNGCYTKGESIGPNESNKYLLVLAVPYGEIDEVTSPKEAIEAFHELLDCSDWFERSIQVLTIVDDKPHIKEMRHEDFDEVEL